MHICTALLCVVWMEKTKSAGESRADGSSRTKNQARARSQTNLTCTACECRHKVSSSPKTVRLRPFAAGILLCTTLSTGVNRGFFALQASSTNPEKSRFLADFVVVGPIAPCTAFPPWIDVLQAGPAWPARVAAEPGSRWRCRLGRGRAELRLRENPHGIALWLTRGMERDYNHELCLAPAARAGNLSLFHNKHRSPGALIRETDVPTAQPPAEA